MSGYAYTARAVPRGPRTRRRSLSYVGAPLAFSGLCLVALTAVWLLSNLVPALQLRDAVLLHDFTLLAHPPLASIANILDHLLEPPLFVLWGIALVAFAVARERPRTALAVAMIMWLAPLCSETLKPLLAHSHQSVGGVFIGAASWPSGHSTAALILGLSAVLVSPPRWRPFTAVVAVLFSAAVGASLLILAWHLPSDVIGGYLVASFWTGLAVACLRLANHRWPQDRPDPI